MIYKQISGRAFSLWSLAIALEGIVAAYFIAREPSETENIFLFGISLQRLIIVIGVIVIALFFLVAAIAHIYQSLSWITSINKKQILFSYVLVGVFVFEIAVLHLLYLIPEYQLPLLSGYLFRLRPILIWLALIFAQTFIFFIYLRTSLFGDSKGWKEYKLVIIILTIVGVIWGLVAITGVGIIPDDLYWNMAGVPLLAWQVWVAVGVTLIGWFLYSRFVLKKRFSRLLAFMIFIGIWIIAAITWIQTPLIPTFNAPGPYPPSKEFYPFVDAALFDLGAQSAIYGKGFFFGTFFDRGLLTGFLTLIHIIFGQRYLVTVGVQSAAYAIFPALLYMLGKKLHSKPAGVMAATLAILKVSNSIAGGRWLSTSHPKLLLTEFPTGVTLLLFTLFLVYWLKNNQTKVYFLAGVGSIIGIGILLRTHLFFMLPVVFIFGFAIWKRQWKLALRDVLVVIIAFFITVSPWMWRNQRVAGEPLFFLQRFDSVIEERYPPQSLLIRNKPVSFFSPRAFKTGTIMHTTKNDFIFDQYQFIPKHFIHNIITSTLILPPSPVFDDLRHVVDNYPYWNRVPNKGIEDISIPMSIFIAVNLVIFSLGLGVAWKRVGFVAFVPLAVFLFYNLANAFARTSGGRYIVPAEWVIYFYYAIGLVELIRFCIFMLGLKPGGFFAVTDNQGYSELERKINWGKSFLVILPFFLMVVSLPIIELASPGYPHLETTDSIIQQLEEGSFFEVSGFSSLEVGEFLESPDAILISGRGFYPRFYSHNEGEPILPGQMTAYTPRDYPRLVFTLLLPSNDKPVVLPIYEPRLHFPDAAKVIVGGCQVGESEIWTSYVNYIDAAFIVIEDEPETVYVRNPEAPLTCPLRKPVCDNNHNCQ